MHTQHGEAWSRVKEGAWCLWVSEPDLTDGPLSSNNTLGTSAVSESWHQGAASLHVAMLLGQRTPSWGTQFVP